MTVYNLWVANFIKIAQCCTFSNYAEIQDGCKKWQENDIGKTWWINLHVLSGSKNFVKIALFRSVSQINVFFAFYTETQDGCKEWRENDFLHKLADDSVLWVKDFIKTALSCTISEINAFLCITQKWKRTTKNGGKIIFSKQWQMTAYTQNFHRNHSVTITETNVFLHFMQKHVFSHVTSLIGRNVTTPYSEIYPGTTAYMCQILRAFTQWMLSYKQ